MSKWKWIAVAVFVAAVTICPSVKAQCTGQYANDPTYPVLLPNQYAAQGGTTATITTSIYGVTNPAQDHKITVTPGTILNLAWTSNNGTSASGYFTRANNPTQHLGTVNLPLSGSTVEWYKAISSDIGNPLTQWIVVADANGNQTTDRITITVVPGTSPGIVTEDRLETNFYQQVITTFGGSSMLTSCQECQAGTTQHCINATHTPYTTISLTNSTSGESQLLQDVQAGNVAHSNESLSGSASLAISVLPGDTGTISIEDKIICSMDGVIFEQTLPKPKTSPSGGSWNPSVTGELAFTKVALKVPTHCVPLVNAQGGVIGLRCDVAYYCSARSSPPDYQPTGLDTYYYTDPAKVPPYWMTMAPGAALVFGKNQPGEIAIWTFPTTTLHQVLTGMGGYDPLLLDILTIAWVSDNSTQDCTKWISGISPWYMPRW